MSAWLDLMSLPQEKAHAADLAALRNSGGIPPSLMALWLGDGPTTDEERVAAARVLRERKADGSLGCICDETKVVR